MRPVVAVTGTLREAAVLDGLGVVAIVGGGDDSGLERRLAALAGQAAGIVSFGMAGALDPALRLGDWVIGTGGDEAWAMVLAARLPAARRGPWHAENRLIADPSEKLALWRRTGALSTDMESHVAALAAAQAGVPFAVLRCISDEAATALPPAVARAMRPDGKLAPGAVLASIAAQPGQLPALWATGRRFSRAYRALRSGARTTGPRLAFDLR